MHEHASKMELGDKETVAIYAFKQACHTICTYYIVMHVYCIVIRVWYVHTRMVIPYAYGIQNCTIRVRYIPYAYGTYS